MSIFQAQVQCTKQREKEVNCKLILSNYLSNRGLKCRPLGHEAAMLRADPRPLFSIEMFWMKGQIERKSYRKWEVLVAIELLMLSYTTFLI